MTNWTPEKHAEVRELVNSMGFMPFPCNKLVDRAHEMLAEIERLQEAERFLNSLGCVVKSNPPAAEKGE